MTDGKAVPIRNSVVVLPNLDQIILGLLLVFVGSLPFKGLLFIERNSFLILLVLLGTWCAVRRQHFFLRTPLDMPLVAFVVWVGLTIPFSAFPAYSLKEFGKLLQQGLMFYVVMYFFQVNARWIQLIRGLIVMSCFIGLYGVAQFDPMNILAVMSFFPSEAWLVTYLIIFLPIAFALAWYEQRPLVKGLYGLVSVLLLGCLLLTQSRAGLFSLLIELIACTWLLKRKGMTALAGAIFVLLIIGGIYLLKMEKADNGTIRLVSRQNISLKIQLHSLKHRVELWKFAIMRIAEHPILGIGYGKETSKMLFGQAIGKANFLNNPRITTNGTHNIFLEIALMVGIPGLLLFIWLAVEIIRMVIGGFRSAADPFAKAVLFGISVAVIGLGARIQFDQMLVGTLAIQFWLLMGVAVLASRWPPAGSEPVEATCGV